MRYLAQTAKARKAMLEAVGVPDVDALYASVPSEAQVDGRVGLPPHRGELDVERIMQSYAAQNRAASDGPFFLGAGCYYRHIPASVDYITKRSEFLTAYTPYQPEIAQGTLQAMFEFQTFIAQLTGQEAANASLYDGATATAEAALMAMRITKRGKSAVAGTLHPHYRETLETYLGNREGAGLTDGEPDRETACVVLPSPGFLGDVPDYVYWRRRCDETGALLVVVVTDVLSLGLLPVPSMADVVCGEGQGIGLPMEFGGPHLGFFACREAYLRQMPGRLCGMTEDADGRRSFVLTLNTREQHIRREKATSNICTNQGLCALAFTVHMALLGEDGFKRLARLNHEAACRLADALESLPGVALLTERFFNEFAVRLPKDAYQTVKTLTARGIIGGLPLDGNRLLVAATEMTEDKDIAALCAALREIL
jgi:glycine dehydrogenase subunit 1